MELQEKPEKVKYKTSDLVIPTPEVFVASDKDGTYKSIYKEDSFRLPRAYIHVQPFSADQDLPDYDMDEEDMTFLEKVLKNEKKLEVDAITFEDMLDRLEKNSGHNVVSAKEAKLLLKEDDELILAVYDYWVDKRLKLKQPLIPTVKSDKRDGTATATSGSSNPYIAFRRRTEKMQTRKNRKNDEASYEKMLKLRRDLSRAVTLLEMVKRREKTKKENLNLTADIFEKRYQTGDWDGKVISEVLSQRQQPPHRLIQPTYMKYAENWLNNQAGHYIDGHRQKRSYNKKRRHKSSKSGRSADFTSLMGAGSSDDERSISGASPSDIEEDEMEGPFAFRRKRNCQYLAPLMDEAGFEPHRGWPWDAPEDGGGGEAKYRYSLASLSTPNPRCVGMVRRRVGRGGRIVLDRAYANYDDLWRSLDFTVTNGCGMGVNGGGGDNELDEDWPHYRPVTPPHCREEPDYDPYKLRLLTETPVGLPTQPIKPPLTTQRSRTSLNGLRTVSVDHRAVDSIIAQNAASAVVSSETMDLFSSGGQQLQTVKSSG